MSTDDLLGRAFKARYDEYYGGSEQLSKKRALAASDSYAHMRSVMGADSFETLIDVGAGEGSLLACIDAAPTQAKLYAVEISESGVAAIKKRGLGSLVEVKIFDGYRIPYPDKAFDVATAIHVLEHVEHERLFLAELKRIARRVVVEVPLENGFRIARSIELSSKYGHINYYTPEVFLNILRTSGLKILATKVTASSLRYEEFLSGPVVGLVKNTLRRAALSVAPRLAVWSFAYLLTAYCEAED
jgi:hypothetical protein